MVCANEPIQTTDNTSGLTRRRLTVEFNRSLWDKNSEAKEMIKLENGIVNGLWKNYLPGLVNWVLDMKTEEMREYLLDTYEKVKSLKRVTAIAISISMQVTVLIVKIQVQNQ